LDTHRVDLLRASPTAVKVYLALQRLANGDHPVAAPMALIEKLTCLSHSTVQDAYTELAGMGLLVKLFPPGYYAVKPYSVQKLDTSYGVVRPHTHIPAAWSRASAKTRSTSKPSRGVQKLDHGVSLTERRVAVKDACRILRVPETGRFVQMSMRKLYGLIKDGFSVSDALEVARYCRAEYDRGDRFKARLNLLHIWSAGQFSPLLAAARTTPAYSREFRSNLSQDEEERREADYQRRIREKGLIQ